MALHLKGIYDIAPLHHKQSKWAINLLSLIAELVEDEMPLNVLETNNPPVGGGNGMVLLFLTVVGLAILGSAGFFFKQKVAGWEYP